MVVMGIKMASGDDGQVYQIMTRQPLRRVLIFWAVWRKRDKNVLPAQLGWRLEAVVYHLGVPVCLLVILQQKVRGLTATITQQRVKMGKAQTVAYVFGEEQCSETA